MYLDIHTHLTHNDFSHDLDLVIQRAIESGLRAVVVNGLDPSSNRKVLELSEKYPIIKPALGIYPLDAINHLNPELPFKQARFDVDSEIQFIRDMCLQNKVIAIGECGLDGYWVGQETFQEQERVFEELISIAKEFDIPLIIHTRKLEKRSIEILSHHKIQKVNFHCFGGKVKLALNAAEQFGWHFSIPANCRKNEAFTKMLLKLPESSILTETDAPYLGPEKGVRNEPANVVGTIAYLAELRKWSIEKAVTQVWSNFENLFSKESSS